MPQSATFRKALRHAPSVLVISEGMEGDRPDTHSDLWNRQHAAVQLVRDVYRGTRHMQSKKEVYLPKHYAEESEDYERRLKRAVLFNALSRTAQGLTGMVFRKEPVLEDVTDVVAAHLEDVDMAGRNLPTFAYDAFLNAILDGHTLFHVEHPSTFVEGEDGEARRMRLDEERAAGVRPYWINIPKDSVINVRWEMRGGKPFITLLVYVETDTEDVGEYGQNEVVQYRVLRPGSFEVWREIEQTDKGEARFELVDSGTTSLGYVPVVAAYARREGFMESCPPLEDLAFLNVSHWVNSNEHEMSLARARIPMPWFAGLEDEGIKWGPNYSIQMPMGAQAGMLESAGSALGASKEFLGDIEARMAALGLAMLVKETRAAETAEAKSIDKAESDSALAAVALAYEDALNACLAIHYDYMGEQPQGRVRINRDFQDQAISPQLLQTLSDMVGAGRLSMDTLWRKMKEGEVLPEDFDPDDERQRIEDEALIGLPALPEAEPEPMQEAA